MQNHSTVRARPVRSQPACPGVISVDKLMSGLDDATELLDATRVTRDTVETIIGNPVTASELAAELNTVIVCQVISEQIKSFRDPAYWDGEEGTNHAE